MVCGCCTAKGKAVICIWLWVAPTCSWPYAALMSFAKIDQWIGKTLFVPPIIKLCQLTRQSQFAVSRLFWFIAAPDGFYPAHQPRSEERRVGIACVRTGRFWWWTEL